MTDFELGMFCIGVGVICFGISLLAFRDEEPTEQTKEAGDASAEGVVSAKVHPVASSPGFGGDVSCELESKARPSACRQAWKDEKAIQTDPGQKLERSLSAPSSLSVAQGESSSMVVGPQKQEVDVQSEDSSSVLQGTADAMELKANPTKLPPIGSWKEPVSLLGPLPDIRTPP